MIPSYIVSTSISEALYGANEFIEEQNTIAENELREKVGLLKSLTIDIGDEVKGHNQLLQETDNTFDRFAHYIFIRFNISSGKCHLVMYNLIYSNYC